MAELMRQKRGGKRRLDAALVAELARGCSNREAAALCAVSQRTVERRMQDAGFRREVVEARDRLVADASGQLAGIVGDAIRSLHSMLMESQSEKTKLACAKTILECSIRFREATEIERRLGELQGRLAAAGGGGDG
jgi:hypothetical protein